MYPQILVTTSKLISLLCLVLITTCASHQVRLKSSSSNSFSEQSEVLYLPSGKFLQTISVGYTNALANILWFNTINYFGKHYASDRNYQWLAHMCEIVTDLTPKVDQPYHFCGSMLAWEAGKPEDSIKLFDKASKFHPEDWRVPYYRGMIKMIFLKDGAGAKSDLVEASLNPTAHPIVKRLAAKLIANHADEITALEFIDRLIDDEQDPMARKILIERRDKIYQRHVEEKLNKNHAISQSAVISKKESN